MSPTERRVRLSIDVPRETRRRIQMAAARRNQSIRQYVLGAVDAKLKGDLRDLTPDDLLVLSERTDPVLTELWDNPKDAAYDEL